jgi:uncharacterized protein
MAQTIEMYAKEKYNAFFIYTFSMAFLPIILSSLFKDNTDTVFQMAIINFLVYLFIFISFVKIFQLYLMKQLKDFVKKYKKYLIIALVGWVIGLALNWFISVLFDFYNISGESKNQSALIKAARYPFFLIPFTVIFAPVVEEIIYRGILFRTIINLRFPYHLNIIIGFILGSTIFGVIHIVTELTLGNPINYLVIAPYFIMGFILCYLYYVTNNIIVPIVMHFFQNLISIIILLTM